MAHRNMQSRRDKAVFVVSIVAARKTSPASSIHADIEPIAP